MTETSTNPKKGAGARKVPLHLVPPALAIGAAVALGEGAPIYGPFNWRDKPVDASTYIGAIERHLVAWKDGENVDPESRVGKTHLEGIAGCIAILLDSIAMNTLIDDRKTGPAAQLVRDTNARLAPKVDPVHDWQQALLIKQPAPAATGGSPHTPTVMFGIDKSASHFSISAVGAGGMGGTVTGGGGTAGIVNPPLTMSQVFDLPDNTPIEVLWDGSTQWMSGWKQSEPAGALFSDAGTGSTFTLQRVTASGTGTKVRKRIV